MAGESPNTPPGMGSPLLGDNRGVGSEGEGVSPESTFDINTPVTFGPPGWGDPPILPGVDSRPFPIGGGENVSKLFSHGSGAGFLRGPPPKISGTPGGFENGSVETGYIGKGKGRGPFPAEVESVATGGAKEVLDLLLKYFSKELTKDKTTGGIGGSFPDKKPWVVLDEKYFRRVDKFTGEASMYRGWLFDLVMTLNQIDTELSDQVNKVVAEILLQGINQRQNYKWVGEFPTRKETLGRFRREVFQEG